MSKSEEFAAAIQRAVEVHKTDETKITLRGLVAAHYQQLQAARAESVSWSDIAEPLTQAGFSISGGTLGRYYSQHQKTLKPSRRNSKATRRRQSPGKAEDSGSAVTKGQTKAAKPNRGKRA